MHAVTGSGRLIAGRYRLQGPIGRGAMGIVWRGRDELLARDVAVKEVHITAQASPADAETIYQRTLREARTAARLSHPGVVTVYDVLEENGSPWIIMALVEARSLDRVIAEDGPLPPHQAARIGANLVAALAAAHAAGVLHRDVKPSNVLVTTDGTAVLTDFGIATFAGDPGITQAGMVVGTPGFTAPERVRGDAATPASDLWSVGATLFAAVEGRGPFDRAGGPAAITTGIATEDAPRAPSAGPLAPVIGSLLSRDPAARPKAAAAARLLAAAAAAGATGEAAVAGAANGAA
ncbi:MAG: serine/threonine-protein kinase, partial [Streptosporangiaceae bacterium]